MMVDQMRASLLARAVHLVGTVLQHIGQGQTQRATAGEDCNAELTAETAQGVDARGARAHPERADAVQALQGLLLDGLHAHGANVAGAGGFEQGGCIGGVGLVAPHVGAHVLGG